MKSPKLSNALKVSIAYTELCLPDYFSGDARAWVCVPVTETGYTSRQLRKAIRQEFAQGAIGGIEPLTSDYVQDEKLKDLADKFYSKALDACLNRDIKFRGKALKQDKKDDPDCEVLLHIVFDIEYEKEDT